MASRYGENVDSHWLRQGSPSGVWEQSISRLETVDNLSALTTQVMTSVAVPIQTGTLITNLTFVSGATAAGTPTNWWFALYDTSGALLAQTADQTSTAWAANTAMTLALATAQRASAAGVYYAACMVKATTPPTLRGVDVGNAVVAGALGLSAKVLAQTSGSSLTTTAPATIATPTTVSTVPFCVVT